MPPSDYEILWYPMRVTYNRELKIKKILDDLVIENFVPMQYDLVHSKGLPKKELVPAIHNLIFVRSNKITLTDLKRRNEELEPLRFMTRPITKGQKENEIIWVPDKQMDNFLRVASVQDNSVMFLENNDFINKIGKRVKITAGVFKDVEGEIKRIKKNKYVVVQIKGVAAVAITYVPASFISEVSQFFDATVSTQHTI